MLKEFDAILSAAKMTFSILENNAKKANSLKELDRLENLRRDNLNEFIKDASDVINRYQKEFTQLRNMLLKETESARKAMFARYQELGK